ncbi:hypothetical protein I4U23_011252 [Adineta vaga]|nr:hypothetical protein I4U23_011252 [Adineta vaga]
MQFYSTLAQTKNTLPTDAMQQEKETLLLAEMTMIWPDNDITHSEYQQKILDESRFYFNDYNLRLFNDPDQCLDFITDLPKTQENRGSDTSLHFDNFLSTGRDRKFARLFAESASQSKQYEAVLMKVTIPPLLTDAEVFRCPFADIVRSGDEEDETEVLFSTGALFRVQKVDIKHKEAILCIVTVTLTHDLDFDDDCIEDLLTFF